MRSTPDKNSPEWQWCLSKMVFATKADALVGASRLFQRRLCATREFTPYPCEFCGQWHLEAKINRRKE